MNRLRELFDAGDFDSIERICRQSPPTTGDEWVLWGRALIALGNSEEAVARLNTGLNADAGAVELRYYFACALARLHRWKEIDEVLEPCMASAKWRSRALGIRAQARLRSGFWARAANDYRELERSHELRPQHRLAVAACLVRSSQWRRALEFLEDLLNAGGDGELVRMLKARCLVGLGQNEQADSSYRDALQKFPDSRELGHQWLKSTKDSAHVMLASDFGREIALREWQSLQAERPHDCGLVHRLALLLTFTAARLQARGETSRAATAWRSALAQWVVLEQAQEWHRDFIDRRCRAYKFAPVDRDRAEFETGLSRQIAGFLENVRSLPPRTGTASIGEDVRREQVACQAARSALVAGGFVDEAGARPFVCGPILLAQLGLAGRFARLCGRTQLSRTLAWTTWPDPMISSEALQNLRWFYSSAGYSLAALQNRDWRGAIQSLRWCACPKCARQQRETPKTCRGDCPEFEERNPGLVDLEQRESALALVAQAASIHADVAAALESLKVAVPSGEAAARHWQSARDAMHDAGRRSALDAHLQATALSRVRSLAEERRYQEAVDLGRAVLPLILEKRELEEELAQVLTSHGVALGSGQESLDALRAAVTLRPEMYRARRELTVGLMNAATEELEGRQFDKSVALAREADEIVGGTHELTDEFRRFREEILLIRVTSQMNCAGEAHSQGQNDIAMGLLEEALNCDVASVVDPERSRLLREKKEACREYLDIVRSRSGD